MHDENAKGDMDSKNRKPAGGLVVSPKTPTPPPLEATSLSLCARFPTLHIDLIAIQRMPPQRHRAQRPTDLGRQTRSDLPHLGYGPAQFSDGFVTQFVEARTLKRPRGLPLTLQQHRQLRRCVDFAVSVRPAWAENTKLNVAGFPDWAGELKAAHAGRAVSFLIYLCQPGKIRSAGSSLLAVFPAVETTHLVPAFGLHAPGLRIKTVTDSGDLLALLLFNVAYDRRIFPSERQRLDVAACYPVLAYTGCRPAEVVDGEKSIPTSGSYQKLFISDDSSDSPEDGPLDEHSRMVEKLLEHETFSRGRPKALCYEDIQLMVIRHPTTNRDTLTMSITFTHHKGSDNKPKSTIFYFTPTKKLVFCLITHIVSIAVLDGALDSPTLDSVEAVFGARVVPPVTCLPLRWKREWLKRPVFRRCDDDLMSPLPYRTLHDYMARQSLDMGYEKPIGPKDWRRNVGNTVNGQASDAVRDQVMRHNNHSNVFQDAYLSAHVSFHVQNAVLGEPLETQVLSMLSHTEIEALEERRRVLKGGQFRVQGTPNENEINRLTALISSRKAAWRKMVKNEYRLYYFHNCPTWDLQRQANGEALVLDNKPPIDLQLADRAVLAGLLCNQPDDLDHESRHQLRIAIGTCMVRLGRLQERTRPEVRGFLSTYAATRPRVENVDVIYSDGSIGSNYTRSPAFTHSSVGHGHSEELGTYASPHLPIEPLPQYSYYGAHQMSQYAYEPSSVADCATYLSMTYPSEPHPSTYLYYSPNTTPSPPPSYYSSVTCPPSHSSFIPESRTLNADTGVTISDAFGQLYIDADARGFDTNSYTSPQPQYPSQFQTWTAVSHYTIRPTLPPRVLRPSSISSWSLLLLRMGQTDRGWSVRACWFVVGLTGFTIVLLDTATILFHSFTRLFDTSSIVLVTSSLLLASASTILHIVRICTLQHVRSGSFPHVKRLLVLALLTTSTLNIVLVVLAAY
ncbi:hypothetical protein GGR54DRAFT_644004 [Hypoxylon sp. NC1633]|nr:hypothetical protein GGR54DRAFT_644004 [Hypoxylon sp. NC1633]